MWQMRTANKARLKALMFEAKEAVKEVVKEEVIEAAIEEVAEVIIEKSAKSQRSKKKEEQV